MTRISLTQVGTESGVVLVTERIEAYRRNVATGDSSVYMVSGVVWDVRQSVAEIGTLITTADELARRARR